jgi:hypothetical protein
MAVPGHTLTFFECTADTIFGYFSSEECRLGVQPADVAIIHHSSQTPCHSADSICSSADDEDCEMLHADPDGLGG